MIATISQFSNLKFLNIPEFIWSGIFNLLTTLVCGLIIAYFTSTFLKEKEEKTRIAGLIAEKRINAEQEILHFLEKEIFKEELNVDNGSHIEIRIKEFIKVIGLELPYDYHFQYATIFKNFDAFRKFFHDYEDIFNRNKLWLDNKVKEHLAYIQLYFSSFNSIPLLVKNIKLPKDKNLSDAQFDEICNLTLLLLGAVCDFEMNRLISELDEFIINSIYKLDLSRPKYSMQRNNMYNVDVEKLTKILEEDSIVCLCRESVVSLIMLQIAEIINCNPSELEIITSNE